ncbi:MAG: tetratricopeptide repeat protein, partial [Candidatus Muiribacteriaceae bacterium]
MRKTKFNRSVILILVSISIFTTGCLFPKRPGKRSSEVRVKKEQDNNAEIHYQIGSVAGYNGKFDLAIKELNKAISINPEYVDA